MQEIRVSPFWRITGTSAEAGQGCLALGPGSGWGTGAHETTQLCLQAIALAFPWRERPGFRALDFGSGSGLLSIAAAKLGAKTVDAIEIDEDGLMHAAVNARLNGVEPKIRFARALDSVAPQSCELVVANILRPVLLEFAQPLAAKLALKGTLVLSGLTSSEVPEIAVRYGGLLGGPEPQVFARGEWRAVVFAPNSG